MKSHLLFALCGASLVASACGGASAEPAHLKAQIPHTQAALNASEFLARAEHAIGGYLEACARGEPQALSTVTTNDLHIEYVLDDVNPDLGTSVDAERCAAIARGAKVTNFWLFPTSDAASVFVRYELQTSTGSQAQLALVEMRDERIAVVRNFSGMPAAVSSVTAARD
jgi:hypothetical protein